MQFNLSTLIIAAAAFAASVRGAAIEERQAQGIPCFVGAISLLGLSIAIDSCEVTNPGDVCSNPGSPVIVQLDDIASLSLAVGVSNICDTYVMTIADIFITDLRSFFLNMGFCSGSLDHNSSYILS